MGENNNEKKGLTPVSFTAVAIADRFWSARQKTHRDVTLATCLDKCEATGRIANFAKAARSLPGDFEGIYFNDSDVYKVLEGVAYSLMSHPDPDLEKRADEIIEKIVAAQESDGYLLCYYSLVEPEKRWTDMSMHEMYCGGHLIEAAVAYRQATGKDALLTVVQRMVDHYMSRFGPDGDHWVTGHEEVELALVKLHRETGDKRYLDFSRWLLEERGHGHGRGSNWDRKGWGPAYCQDAVPVRDQELVTGHAVRAMYLYTGMADVAGLTHEAPYMAALLRLWEHVTLRNMYVTGGIGPSRENEGFTQDYDLPNDTAYCETCASVGMVLWGHRMALLLRDGRYADVMERAMYNGALAGVSLGGDRFFYVNPLSSMGDHHREEWYDCSCCPTQIARFIPSIGGYAYAVDESSLWVNLYVAGKADLIVGGRPVVVTQATDYPWHGTVEILVEPDVAAAFAVCLRLPGWCRSASLLLNAEPVADLASRDGYLRIDRKWSAGDRLTLHLDMPVTRVRANPRVEADAGKVALQRGPLVYCVEEVDNGDLGPIRLLSSTHVVSEWRPDLLGGVQVLRGTDHTAGISWTAVPYYAWDNREPGRMEVWLPEDRPGDDAYLYALG